MGSRNLSETRTAAERELSRRDLLRALALGSVAGGLAACGFSTATPGATGSASAGRSTGVPAATASPSPEPTPVPSVVAGLTLRQKIGQLLVVGFVGQRASRTSAVGKAIAAGELGGVILFDRNIASPSQLADLTGGLTALAPDAASLLVAVDQEGGRVARLGPGRGFPSVASQAVVGAHAVSYAVDVYGAMAGTLSNAGVNFNLAPVVDVNINPKNPAIGALGRSFSADPAVVTAMGRASIRAHHGHGVLTALKHFPGLGSATVNTDVAPADVTRTWRTLELEPYRELLTGDADCVMVGHTLNRTLDPAAPASLSNPTVQDLLRGDLGWQGPVITDDLQARAIAKQFKQTDAIAAALNAGVDLLLFSTATSSPAFYRDLVTSIAKLVTSGRVDEARIDEAVGRAALLRGQL